MATRRTYGATLITGDDGKVYVPVPFDPDEVWGAKTRHAITGTVDGIPVRGQVQAVGGGRALVLGAGWIRDRGHGAGDSTRRRPEERPIRIAEMAELLRAGKKQR